MHMPLPSSLPCLLDSTLLLYNLQNLGLFRKASVSSREKKEQGQREKGKEATLPWASVPSGEVRVAMRLHRQYFLAG